jgi:hypothetical protein
LRSFRLLAAGVAELADALDSKSSGRKAVWVRAPPPATMLLPMRKAHFSNPAEKIYDGFRTENADLVCETYLQGDAQQNAQDDCRKVLGRNGPGVLLWSSTANNQSIAARPSQ